MDRRARVLHGLTVAVALAALVLQLVLVVIGNPVLDDVEPPGLGSRLYRFLAYFTIESNLLVLVSTLPLVRDPSYDGPRWRLLRLAAVVAITVTGLVHFVLLRPLLDLHGLDLLADRLLHLAVPILAVLGWALLGPRPRVTGRLVATALAFPVGWTAWTLVFGAVDGWYPYPFLDPDEHGWGAVVLAVVGITVLFLLLFALVRWLDRRLARTGATVGT